MLFTRWQHHLQSCSGFPYAPLKAMVTKISKWSGIQDSFWITPKIESLVVCAIPDIPSKFQNDPSITFWVILLTHTQADKQTKSGKNKSLSPDHTTPHFYLPGGSCNCMLWLRVQLPNHPLGTVFPSPIKSNLISDLLISDQLDVLNWSLINCVSFFHTYFDLQLHDPRFVDSPSTELTLR